jgi:hypothetical protein
MPRKNLPPTNIEVTPEPADANLVALVRADSVAESGQRGGPIDALKGLASSSLKYVEISPDVLEAQLTEFLAKMDRIVQKLPKLVGQFHLDEVELSVEITGKGTVAFLGTGGELGSTGGLRFTLKRNP